MWRIFYINNLRFNVRVAQHKWVLWLLPSHHCPRFRRCINNKSTYVVRQVWFDELAVMQRCHNRHSWPVSSRIELLYKAQGLHQWRAAVSFKRTFLEKMKKTNIPFWARACLYVHLSVYIVRGWCQYEFSEIFFWNKLTATVSIVIVRIEWYSPVRHDL